MRRWMPETMTSALRCTLRHANRTLQRCVLLACANCRPLQQHSLQLTYFVAESKAQPACKLPMWLMTG